MAGTNGLDVLQRRLAGTGIPVIVITTAYDDVTVRGHALAAGAAGSSKAI
jgi:hypothetical protein